VKRLALLLIVMPVVVVTIALVTPERIPNLAAIGTRVPGFTTNGVFLGRSWRSPEEIVFFDASSGRRSPQFLNVDTGSLSPDSPVSGLTNRLLLAGDSFLTPDLSRRLNRSLTRWILTDLRGKELMAWPMRDYEPHWAPDGTSWITVDQSRRRVTKYTVQSTRPTVFRLPDVMAQPLAYDGKETVISVQPGAARSRLRFTTLTGHSNTRDVTMPPGTSQVFEVKASPQGDRIGWYVGRGARSGPWLHKLLRFFRIGAASPGAGYNAPTVDTEGIWISKIDGTDMRPVGEVVAEWAPVGMGSFTWRPDGRQVLITYRNGIYRIPVE
jgi:hypothetical protein